MNEEAAFYIDAARRCYDIARRCSIEDREIAKELTLLGQQLVARAISHGAAPGECPDP
jgi:hypothetical protein